MTASRWGVTETPRVRHRATNSLSRRAEYLTRHRRSNSRSSSITTIETEPKMIAEAR